MNVLLTGGAGYIGSHTAIALTQAGLSPVILDNFSNSNPEVLHRLKTITGLRFECIQGDVADVSLVKKIIQDHHVRAVIHFAADKAVGESVQRPIKYFKNNIGGVGRSTIGNPRHRMQRFRVFEQCHSLRGA